MKRIDQIMQLRDKGLSRRDIADRLGISLGTVHSMLARYSTAEKRAKWAAKQREIYHERRAEG